MPLVQPSRLREKFLIIGGAGSGKTTAPLSMMWWAKQSDDDRKCYWLDTDDESILHVLNEPKYEGMLAEEGGNLHVSSAYKWDDYVRFTEETMKVVKRGDVIVIDFISHAWKAVQNDYLENEVKKKRSEALLDAARKGLSGWELYSVDFNWQIINPRYFEWIDPLLIASGAHIFMIAEEEVINQKRPSDDDVAHMREFGNFKAVGQKKLPHQCRTFLRFQHLARGRVMTTMGKDRARPMLQAVDLSDFYKDYMCKVAGWDVE